MSSLKYPKKHLSFDALSKMLSDHSRSLPDSREPNQCKFTLHDVVMSAFSCMYFQQSNFAEFQRQMEIIEHKNNLRTLFDVENIPKESQFKEILDALPSRLFAPIFKDIFSRLRRHKHLEAFAIFPHTLLCVIDGTQYHSSHAIHCKHCLHKTHTPKELPEGDKKGKISYSHSVLQGAIMHPDKKQVLPVMPEGIRNTDGTEKQDCESNAAKRFIGDLKDTYPRQRFIIGGDGLMSHQPMIEEILNASLHYLFVAKPGDHTYLFEWVNTYDDLPSHTYTDDQEVTHYYRWKNNVPLNGQEKTVAVNFFEYISTDKDGVILYKNSWVTDITLCLQNIKTMTDAGRCRWKIENECFNTLKNQGYELKHNYGHGKKHLSYNMYLLTLIAFYFHQVFELTDGAYQACRQKFVSKRSLWEKIRGVVNFFIVDSWVIVMDFLLNQDDYKERRLEKIK